jgi:internalin A
MDRVELLATIKKAKRSSETRLNLSRGSIRELPEEIGQLTSLTSLSLDFNELIELPKSIGQLVNLRSLDLSANQLTRLPESIGNLTKLTSLHLSANQLTRLPESIGYLANLICLEVIDNKLISLPDCIGNLTKLETLDARSNKIKNLPQSLRGLICLETLWLWENNLESLPDSIKNLASLKSLNLGENRLNSLPNLIGKLNLLEDLTLHSNQIETLPESIGHLASLVNLDLRSNQIKALPDSIVNLSSLRNIDLSSNQIYQFPDSVTHLKRLEKLNLRENQLSVLPDSIGRMKGLIELNCNANRLEYIPESIGELEHLESLVLYKNNLQDLPNSIAILPKLREDQFFFGENPWTEIPPEIVKQGSRSILRYCRQRLIEGSDDCLYEAKLLIVGEGGAGKTSLANKLINSKYQLKLEGSSNPEKSTEGIDVLHLNFRHPSGNFFRINIWDFGGQEIYHATHQFFLTKRSLYLLVADTRQDSTDFNYWLEVVELLSEASPTLIIKNEKQNRPCKVNENQLRSRFLNLKDVLPTNLSINRGLAEIVSAVYHHISQLPHIGTPLPKTWVRVRSALETDSRNYITQNEFLDLCATHGFKNHEDKLQLSEYLHDLGVCLHFQEDDILQRYVILKPEWGTTAVYKVLDTPKVLAAFGHFTIEDLKVIWADQQHADMRPELLRLMENFKLCYEIPHRPKTYIAPQLLSPNEPEYQWSDTDNLIVRYQYEFMPKGIITRFIVGMHRLIDHELVWKDGVILTDRDARAEIIEDRYHKGIRIRISGQLKRSLLEKIRGEFDNIHYSYNKTEDPPEKHRLRYQEYIPCNCLVCNGSQIPHSYALQDLQKRLKDNRHEIECNISYQMVNVQGLIDDTMCPDAHARSTEKGDDRNIINNYYGDRVGGDKMGGDKVGGDKTTQ